MEFFFEVMETRVVRRAYTVEADTMEEAEEKAEIGDTIGERTTGGSGDVINREVIKQRRSG